MKEIWKILTILSLSCFILFGCGQEAGTVNQTQRQEQENADGGTIKKDVADFCSKIDLSKDCFLVIITDEEQGTLTEQLFSDGDNSFKEAKEIFENKIQNSQFDSVYINDIKDKSYEILYETENMWSDLKNGKIGIDDYEDITEKTENISNMCDELKSYLK